MSLMLSAGDLARCEAVSRVMLSPLSVSSVDDWRREVARTLRELFQSDRTIFALPRAEKLDFVSEDLDRATLARFEEYIDNVGPGPLRAHDPALDRWFALRRRRQIDAYNDHLMDEATDRTYVQSLFHRDIVQGGSMHDHLGLSVDLPHGETFVCLSYDRSGTSKFADSGLFLLRALLPAFKAGLDALTRLQNYRQALDALTEAIVVYNADGRELYRNAALGRLLDVDPAREQVEGAIRLMVRKLHPLCFPRPDRQGESPFAPAVRDVSTPMGRYTLRGVIVASGTFDGEASVMVSVTSEAVPVLPDAATLRARYELTRREAEVALLLAEGLTSDQLAERLFISVHTVRRHTERVLDKLGLNSRKALALKLMQGYVAA